MKVMYCSLLWLKLHIRAGINIPHLCIPGTVAPGRGYISYCFFFSFLPTVLFNCLCVVFVFFKCVINLTSCLFKSNFVSFPIRDSAHLLSYYYYYYNYHFYCYSLLIFFLHVLSCYYFSFPLFSNAKISLISLISFIIVIIIINFSFIIVFLLIKQFFSHETVALNFENRLQRACRGSALGDAPTFILM